jgi:hypothetical protein
VDLLPVDIALEITLAGDELHRTTGPAWERWFELAGDQINCGE